MAQIRTLKLNLLADVTKFGAGMVEARGDVNKLSTASQRAGKAVSAAFVGMGVSAGYAALRIGKEAVEAAREDEKSSRILAEQLRKTTNANDEQIASVEKYIGLTQLRVGVQDDKLRPSFARLLRSTEDVAKAQDLLNLSLDISVATGKDVDTVANALGKTWDGSASSLGRLGLGIDSSILKSGDLNLIFDTLRKTFGGFADKEAKTFDGQLRIVNIRLDELKESAGTQLLPVLSNLLKTTNQVAIGFSGGTGSLANSMSAVTREGYYSPTGGENLGSALKNVADNTAKLFGVLKTDGDKSSSILNGLAKALNLYADALGAVADNAERTKRWAEWLSKGGVLGSIARIAMDKISSTPQRATGGSVTAGKAYTVGEFGRETFIPNTSGRIVPNAGGGSTVININGVIDAESARRSIEKLLQNSARRTGSIDLVGATL